MKAARIGTAVVLLFFASLAAAEQRDFSGVYMSTTYQPTTTYGSYFLIIVQRGNQVVLLNPQLLADSAPYGSNNNTGVGMGTVSGNAMDVPVSYPPDMYCLNHNTYTISDDGNNLSGVTLSSEATARGRALGYDCSFYVGRTTTRVKVF